MPAWTKEEDEILLELWENKSAAEIGKIMDRTRGSVIGRVNRLKERANAPKAFEANGRRLIKFIDLKESSCRWPFDTNKGIRYCGKKKCSKVYCEEHTQLAYKKHKRKSTDYVEGKFQLFKRAVIILILFLFSAPTQAQTITVPVGATVANHLVTEYCTPVKVFINGRYVVTYQC